MTIESLACPSCGSTQVKEIKAGTYFCDHCEALFKHVDPTQVTVAPAFCTCGNPIAFQCNLCRAGLCKSCEAAVADGSGENLIEVVGYGYRLSRRTQVRHGTTVSAYQKVRESVVRLALDGEYTPLVMPARKLRYALDTSSPVTHLCWDCLASGMPRLAEAIDQGLVCEDPFCPNASSAHCTCCNVHYCSEGLTPDAEPGAVILTGNPDDAHRDLAIPVYWPSGICWGCAQEGTCRMRDVIRREFTRLQDTDPPASGPSPWQRSGRPTYRLAHAVEKPLHTRKDSGSWTVTRQERRESKRSQLAFEAYAQSLRGALAECQLLAGEIQTRWRQEQLDHSCTKAAGYLHNDNHPYASQAGRPWSYVLVDGRDHATPSALPGLMARA